MLRSLREEALDEVTAYGLQTYGGLGVVRDVVGPVPAAAGVGTTGGGAPAAATAAKEFSATNNQEADVDEPDVVKTDGRVMVLIRRATSSLVVLDVSGDRPEQVGSLKVLLDGGGHSLLLVGDTVVVLGQRWTGRQVVVAEVYTIADPASPRHLRTFLVDGALLDARLVHGRVVLVTSNVPRMAFTQPQQPGTAAERVALQANRRVVARAGAEQWLSAVRVPTKKATYPARCDQASKPGVPSGTRSTSIVTLDPQADAPTSNQTVIGGGDTLYASSSALYLATASWADQQRPGRSGVTTALHGFDITDPDEPSYLGSGSVPGTVVNRYALSEHEGYLRVATTLDPVGRQGLSDNRVTVLEPAGGVLTKVGQVTGLGRGQRIYGVRFLGDVGYVVTFRQVDPLYTIDLSDPRRPRTLGELHISGFSSSLYPLTKGRLLGVGQDVSTEPGGRTLGAQAEVFDVSRLSAPRLVGKKVWPEAYSPAADDQHALLWWAPASLVVMPVNSYQGSSAAMVLRVGPTGSLTQVGTVTAPSGGQSQGCCPGSPGITRALVVGELLYSVADDGVVTNPLDEVTEQRWLPFR